MATPPTQLSWPLAIGADGSFVETVQDSEDEIRRSGGLCCDTRPGELPWNRAYGTPSPLGTTDPEGVALALEVALSRHEPRAAFAVTVLDGALVEDRNLDLAVDLEDA